MEGKPEKDDTSTKNERRLEAALTPGALAKRATPPTQSIASGLQDVQVVRELAAKHWRSVAEYWGKMRYWSLEESVVLVLGKDPREYERTRAHPLATDPVFRLRFPELNELAKRASECGDFGDSGSGHIAPWVFLGWAARMGYSAPVELIRVVEAQGKPPIDLQGMFKSVTSSLDTVAKQRDMLLEDRNKLKDVSERLIAERDALRDENADLRAKVAEWDAKASQRWPWGNHETDLLRKLAEAAELWKPVSQGGNYDPDDNTTAPTNEMVKERLLKAGVAVRVCEVMAQILRADDLPKGPRR